MALDARAGVDRRGFVRGLLGLLSWLGGVSSLARASQEAPQTAFSIHRATRNTAAGALGDRVWRLSFRARRSKAYGGIPRLALPLDPEPSERPLDQVVRAWSPPAAIAATPLPLEDLGHLLRLTNGVTGRWEDVPLRAAPSAGALYAGEVYLVAVAVAGLPPGVYNFEAPRHALVPIRPGLFGKRVVDALERPAVGAAAPAFVLLTNVFQRYTHRYRNRGYRYAFIDTGHIGENLRLAAAEASLAVSFSPRFHDDALNRLLEIDGREEAVCACYALGRPGSAAGPGQIRRFVEKQRAAASPELSGSAPERYHEATKLALAPRAPGPAPDVSQEHPVDEDLVAPPPREPPGTSVRRTIQVRRSAELFRREPMDLADLGFALDLAMGNTALDLAPGLGLWVLAHRVKGLEPGIYRWSRAPRGLARVSEGDFSGRLRRICLGQEKASEAAVGVAMVAPLAASAESGGERSYRDLLMAAGAIAQRLYLAAEATGLAARNLAAFIDDDLDALLGLDGARRAVVHLTLLGPGD